MEQGLGLVSLPVDIICFRNLDIVNQHIANLAQGHNLVDAFPVQQIQPLQGIDVEGSPHLGGVFGGDAVKQLKGTPYSVRRSFLLIGVDIKCRLQAC